MSNESNDPLTWHQILTLLSFVLPSVLDSMSFSLLQPFFPVEAQRKGAKPWTIGAIFTVYALFGFAGCVLWGKYLPRIGAKNMYLVGLIISGIFTQIFGILIRLPNTEVFVACCFITRIIMAIGSSARETALYTICANSFPGRVAVTISISEVLVGVGYSTGPAIGGVLYEIGGYELPFYVVGIGVVVSGVAGSFLLPKQVKVEETSGSIIEFLRIWQVWPIILAVFIDSTWFAFFDPTLSIHLQQFNLSPIRIGLFYFITSAVYTAVTPIAGYFVDATGMSRPPILFGFVLSGLGYLLVGPSPVIHLPSKLWIVALGMCIIELGWSFSLVTTFQDMLLTAERYGLHSTIHTQSVVSGIFNGVFCLGNALGPSLSSVMVLHLGFSGSCTVMSISAFLVVIILGIFTIFEHQLTEWFQVKTRKYTLLHLEPYSKECHKPDADDDHH